MRRQFRVITYVFGSVDDQDFHWECGQFCIICQGLLLHDRQIHLCTLIHFKHKLSNEGFNKQLCIEQGVEQIILTCHIHKFPEKININISLLFKITGNINVKVTANITITNAIMLLLTLPVVCLHKATSKIK